MSTLQERTGSERSVSVDAQTGATVIQWTAGPHKDQHLYFTSPSVTADDRWLVFLSDRSGHPNLHAIDRRDGSIRPLSRNESGLLRGYVYPQGGHAGLAKASPCLDPVRNRVYYIRQDTVYRVDLDRPGIEQRLCEIPAGWFSAFNHVSPDGKTLCIPCTDPRAFADGAQSQWDQLKRVPGRMDAEGLITRLYLVDTETGKARIAAEVPLWVTHVQFDPAGTGRIIFNREGFVPGTGRPLPDRIWCLEPDGAYRPLGQEPANEWRSHENWSPDGRSIVYHGARDEQPFLANRRWDGTLVQETSIAGLRFYHATAALDGRRIFIDRPDGLISIVDPFADGDRTIDLCRHDSSMVDQDAHVHPITTQQGQSVIFTTDRGGACNVYEVDLSTVPGVL